MSKKNRKFHPKKPKYKNLKYQIKEVELARLEKANVPMLTQTEKQYRNHAIKFANWCKEQYGCRMLDECSTHVQDYADFLVAQGKSPSTIHTYLAGICRICGVPLADIQKPIRVVAENTRSRGTKAVDERKDAGREVSPRLYDFASIVGIRRNEYLHLTPAVRRRHDGTILLVSPESVERNIYTLHQRTWLRMILGIHVYWFAKEKAENVRCNVFYQTN